MTKYLITLGVVGLLAGGCNLTTSSIMADICSSATTLQGSVVKLNSNQQLALTGLLSACAETAGGTVVNSVTLAKAIIDEAILLQNSGLLSKANIRAQAPEGQRVLERIKVRIDQATW